MKKVLLALILAVSSAAFAQKQKVTVEDDIIYVDGVEYATMEKKGSASPTYTIKSLAGAALMSWQFYEFNDPKEVENANPQGRVTYYQVTFFGDKQQCEIKPTMVTQKGVAKCIVENELLKDGIIDQEAENNFVLINGMKFTQQKQNTGGTTIIINN
jgi:hypothetical protein